MLPAKPAPTPSSTPCRRATPTSVGEGGTRLSGGERQRIAPGRAFLVGARLVVLDEATSHLDAASEAIIRDAVQRLGRERAVLIVSHRLRLVSSPTSSPSSTMGGSSNRGRLPALAARTALSLAARRRRIGRARMTTFRRLFGLMAGQRRWIVDRRGARVPGGRFERGADGDVGLPDLEGGVGLERRRGRAGDHRGPRPGHRAGGLPLSRAVRDPSRDVRDPGRPARLVLRRDRAARPGPPGDTPERRPAARIVADIETLEDFYVRVVIPPSSPAS
jgi:hypothetical protein